MTTRAGTTGEDGTVVVEREFDAPREAVWRAFTDPDQFAQWFGPDGLVVPRDSLAMDARSGGGWSARLQAADGTNHHEVRARFTEVIPGELLAAEEDFHMAGGEPVRLHNRIEFHDAGPGRTLLRIVQGPHRDNAAGARAAWESSFGRLARLLCPDTDFDRA